MNKVRVKSLYVYNPVGMDLFSPCAHAEKGQTVRVVNKFGCPPANTMGHCYIESLDGEFLGLVLTNSLTPLKEVK